jgi:hypothetical protein
MLGMVLLDYAQVLRNITVGKVFYGNFEARKSVNGVSIAPMLDVTSFVELQSWTAAARSFLEAGNASRLANLCEPENPGLSKNLSQFAPAILTCRGTQLHRDLDIDSFKALINTRQNEKIAAQLKPLLVRVQQKLSPFESNNLNNGLHAVQWCIDNGLIQQGFTFLLETVISLMVEKTFGMEAVNRSEYRNAVGAALNDISVKKVKNIHPLTKDQYAVICQDFEDYADLKQQYKKLTGKIGLRNDINHCGYREEYASPMDLTNELSAIFQEIKNILN